MGVFDNKDERPARGGWASGNYYNKCLTCNEGFLGDKRAKVCASCAYSDSET